MVMARFTPNFCRLRYHLIRLALSGRKLIAGNRRTATVASSCWIRKSRKASPPFRRQLQFASERSERMERSEVTLDARP